jgi:ABC-type nitrate/sulfonate/bicarbonate transport system permease component
MAIPAALPSPRTRRTLPWRAVLGRILPPLAVLALIVGLWQLYVTLSGVPEYLVPGPGAVAERVLADPAYFYREGLITLTEAMLGLALGAGLAFAVGAFLAHSPALERSVMPWAVALKVTPIVAVAPLFTIWFGFGLLPKVLIAALITFFPVLINTIVGLRAVNPGVLDLAQSFHASPWEVFAKLRVPSALPYLFAALKVSVTLALIGAVVAEWGGASRGLGRVILLSHTNLDMPSLFAAVLVLATLGVGLMVAVALVERSLLFWHDAFLDRRP